MAIHLMRPATPLRILCLAGDGIGPEIMSATCAVLDAVADLRNAFEKGLLPTSLEDERYFNIKRMQSLRLQ